MLLINKNNLYNRVAAWQYSQTNYIRAGGLATSSWVASAGLGAGASANGRTFIAREINHRIRQHGLIYRIDVLVDYPGNAGKTMKFKLFRPNGTNLDFIADSNIIALPLSAAAGAKCEIMLTTPLPCQPGDILGFWSEGDDVSETDLTLFGKASGKTWYYNNDILDSIALSSLSEFTYDIDFDIFIKPPYLLVTGDSIARGFNVSTTPADKWRSIYDVDGPEGNIEAQVQQRLREIVGNGTMLQYQNFALGSIGLQWVAETGLVDGLAVKPNSVIVHAGVNDTSIEWPNLIQYLDAIKDLINATSPIPRLFIDEVLPTTILNDYEAGQVRDFNTGIAIWCAANNATMIKCWSAFGQLRESTGYNDDINTTYTYDGLHLSLAGEDLLARIWKQYL
jgi:lysophospholipase L1-like esterase